MKNENMAVIDDEDGQDVQTPVGFLLAADVDRARRKADEERDARWIEYGEILRRHNDAQPGDGFRLIELAKEIGADLDADLIIVRRAEAMQKDVATVADKKAQIAQIEPEIIKLSDEFARTRAAFNAKIEPLNQRREMLFAELRGLSFTEAGLAQLKTSNWRIFGLPDPQIAAKTRVVFQEVLGQTGDWPLESLMRQPKFNWDMNDRRFSITGDPYALSIARQIVNADHQFFYIVNQSQFDAHGLKPHDRLIVVDRPGPIIGDTNTAFVRLHFQSPERFDELKKQFLARVKKEKKQIETKGYIG